MPCPLVTELIKSNTAPPFGFALGWCPHLGLLCYFSIYSQNPPNTYGMYMYQINMRASCQWQDSFIKRRDGARGLYLSSSQSWIGSKPAVAGSLTQCHHPTERWDPVPKKGARLGGQSRAASKTLNGNMHEVVIIPRKRTWKIGL